MGYREAQFITICKPVVDHPLSVVAVEVEVPRDPRRDNGWQCVEHLVRGRETVVGDSSADTELHTVSRFWIASSKNIALWTLAVLLLQAVLQANLSVTSD